MSEVFLVEHTAIRRVARGPLSPPEYGTQGDDPQWLVRLVE